MKMEKFFSGKLWKMFDDVDTDNIIPGRRGTIPIIDEMKKYAFEYLKPTFGSTAKEGDIIVAGKNFRCGSSREQAASVIVRNGVHCIIAKSFARIFFRNAFTDPAIYILTADNIKKWLMFANSL
jgi:3-isopropylmalate/(R)-2-methylmalate dehydratase large subunit